MTGAAKPAEQKPTAFFVDFGLGDLLSGTGQGGGGKGAGISLGGIDTGNSSKAKSYQPTSFSDKGLADKKWSRGNQQVGDKFRKEHPGYALSSLYAGDLGSKGGLTLSYGYEGGNKGDKKDPVKPTKAAVQPGASKKAPKQPIVPPNDMRRSYDPPITPLGSLGSIGLDEDASAWDKPKTWKAPNGTTYAWGDPMASFDGQSVPKGW